MADRISIKCWKGYIRCVVKMGKDGDLVETSTRVHDTSRYAAFVQLRRKDKKGRIRGESK